MAGYQCMYHDGTADAVNIHQRLGEPGLVATCDDCDGIYHIQEMARSMGITPMELSEALQQFMQWRAAEQPSGTPAEPEQEPSKPDVPHPAIIVTGDAVTAWDWCRCDRGEPHTQDGTPVTPAMLGLLQASQCNDCKTEIRGTVATIESLLSVHTVECPASQEGGQS